MGLTEKERKAVGSLRNCLFLAYILKNEKENPIDVLSNDEIEALYYKIDTEMEEEGNVRRMLGDFDEMYVLEYASIKSSLQKECKKTRSFAPRAVSFILCR